MGGIPFFTFSSLGRFDYYAYDPGEGCGGMPPTPASHGYPSAPEGTPLADRPNPCLNRGAAPNEADAIIAARDVLTTLSSPPDPSAKVTLLPPSTATPTVREVLFANPTPSGIALTQMDGSNISPLFPYNIGAAIGPRNQVVRAFGSMMMLDAQENYPLRPAAELIAALRTGDDYAIRTLPQDASGNVIAPPSAPYTVQMHSISLMYTPVFTIDARPYLLPVAVYTGTAETNESKATGKPIVFITYVDAVAHPASRPVPITMPPLPMTPDSAGLPSRTYASAPISRTDFDNLATYFGSGSTIALNVHLPYSPIVSAYAATYPDGSTLSVESQRRLSWEYHMQAIGTPGAVRAAPATRDVALASARQFFATHPFPPDNLGMPFVDTEQNDTSHDLVVCYPALIGGYPVVDVSGRPYCGLNVWVSIDVERITVRGSANFLDFRRDDSSPTHTVVPPRGATIPTQTAIDALDSGSAANIVSTGQVPSPPFTWRVNIPDETQKGTPYYTNWGNAAPNRFIVDAVTLVYTLYADPQASPFDTHVRPAWLITGTMDCGDRHRLLPFRYVYQATP